MLLSFIKKLTLAVLNWLESKMDAPQDNVDLRTKAMTGSHPTYLSLTESGPLGPFVAGR